MDLQFFTYGFIDVQGPQAGNYWCKGQKQLSYCLPIMIILDTIKTESNLCKANVDN